MIDEKQILYLEKLARIQLSDEQRAVFSDEIGRVLDYMDRLAAIDLDPQAVEEAEPLTGGGRADELRGSLDRAALLVASPDATSEYMTVPRAVQ